MHSNWSYSYEVASYQSEIWDSNVLSDNIQHLVSSPHLSRSLSRPLGITLHFLCSRLVCCKIKAVLSSCGIHLPHPHPHRARQHMDVYIRFFPHASECDSARGRAHTLCPLAYWHLPQRLLSPQRSSQAAILVRSAVIALTMHRSLGDSHTCLLALSAPLWTLCSFFRRSSLLINPLVYLVVG